MNTTSKISKLSRLADVAVFILMFLIFCVMGLILYTFNEYRRDAQASRSMLCQSRELTHTDYCGAVRNGLLPGSLDAE